MARRKTLPFHIVDVFAVEPLTGNPLAVVDGGAELTIDLFQRIAREFNQSETTFVMPPTRPQADWRLRSFHGRRRGSFRRRRPQHARRLVVAGRGRKARVVRQRRRYFTRNSATACCL